MNILIPDIWLSEYLKTKATPDKIKECLSLCGPSVERIYGKGKETVYDIEITGNRPDAMSVIGVAREAATILPRFGIAATLTDDPYAGMPALPASKGPLNLKLKTDSVLNPRWMSVVIDNVTIGISPTWLTQYLTLSGIRSLNTVVDVTNFLMRAYGQPAHVFDYDAISGHEMRLRASKKGEILTTLDGKRHALHGGDIVIEDGTGTLVDLCGIMGGENSSVTEKTKRVMLFLQNYDAAAIRRTSMALSHRTEASSLFEKGLDTELVRPVFARGIQLLEKLTGGSVNSPIIDLYPHPYKASVVRVTLDKIRSYMGTDIKEADISQILTSLGFGVKTEKSGFAVTVPSFRRDVTIDVDIIEEIARMYGYHNIKSGLPNHAPPVAQPDPVLYWEEEIKTRLRDWGFTEIISYSMIAEDMLTRYGDRLSSAYRIANPLSQDWLYMRPHLLYSMLPVIQENLSRTPDLKLFELGNAYRMRKNNLPEEVPTLIALWSGEHFLEAKGLAEAILDLFGLDPEEVFAQESKQPTGWYTDTHITIGPYGSLGILAPDKLAKSGITTPVTRVYLDFASLVAAAKPARKYIPVPNHPASEEDLSFIVPDRFAVGPLMQTLKAASPHVYAVRLLDTHKDTRTLHVTYLHPDKTLTSEEIAAIRKKLLATAEKTYGIRLKT